jgi:flagellar biosynthesis protein FliQ
VYTVFGVFTLLIALVIGIITAIIQAKKAPSGD